MGGPLDGVRVVDLSVMISGPLATMMLADQGADVIKVEAPGLGDLMRHIGSSRNGMSALFALCNRGKRSVVVDLKSEEGCRTLGALVADADVIVQNFRPGAMERLGFGYEAVRATNPDVVFVSISGFGPDGPYAGKRVYDNVVQGYSGFTAVQGDAITGTPAMVRTLVCDKVTAYTVHQAITAALFARERGAGGQHVEIAMLDATVAFLWPDAAMDIAMLEDDVVRYATIGSGYQALRMVDGFATTGAVSDSEFVGLCRALGRDDVAEDPRFATLPDRVANLDALAALDLPADAAKISVEDFLRACEANDVPAAPLRSLEELVDDPQVAQNRIFTETVHPVAGRLRQARPAPRFSATPAGIAGPAPRLGEHTEEVLRELQGRVQATTNPS